MIDRLSVSLERMKRAMQLKYQPKLHFKISVFRVEID